MKKIANSDVAAINFETRQGGFRVSTTSDITRDRVVAFLQTTLQGGGDTTWLEALQTLTPNSTFIVCRLRLGIGDIYFDVRVDVPYEGEVLICIQDTSVVVSTLKELNSHLQKDNENAKKYIDRELRMLQEDPSLLTLQWTQDGSDTSEVKSDRSDTERQAAFEPPGREHKTLAQQSTNKTNYALLHQIARAQKRAEEVPSACVTSPECGEETNQSQQAPIEKPDRWLRREDFPADLSSLSSSRCTGLRNGSPEC